MSGERLQNKAESYSSVSTSGHNPSPEDRQKLIEMLDTFILDYEPDGAGCTGKAGWQTTGKRTMTVVRHKNGDITGNLEREAVFVEEDGMVREPDRERGAAGPEDSLERIFAMQRDFNRRVGVDTDGLDAEQKSHWILQFSRALSQETAELTDCCPWKWWRQGQTLDEQNARVEVIDLFHFVVSLAQVLGMSAKDVLDAYIKKNRVNHQRQDANGYREKDPDDCRHI